MNTEPYTINDVVIVETEAKTDDDILAGYTFRSKRVATTPKPSRYIRVDDPPPAKPLKDRKRLLARKLRK